MTKYARLKKIKDNFIKAAANAKCNFMISLWTKRADDIQNEIDNMTIEEASSEIGD